MCCNNVHNFFVNRKQLGSPKKDVPLYKKRNLDFTDYAYREAVNRLKFLLAESYTPSNKPSISNYYHKHDESDDTDNVSVSIYTKCFSFFRIFPHIHIVIGGWKTRTFRNIKISPSKYIWSI